MTKKKKLTLKQRKFLVEYFKTGNATKSALKAYNTTDYSTASQIGSQNLRLLHEPVKALMEKHGISVGTLIVTLADGLQAKKIHGTSDNFVEIKDHAVRHKYLETASKWLKVDSGEKNTNVQVNVFADSAKRADGFIEGEEVK